MTWCFNHRGSDYQWIVELYKRMNLPVLPEVVRAFQKATKERMTELEKKKTDEAKQKRVSQKIARSEDQEEQKNGSSGKPFFTHLVQRMRMMAVKRIESWSKKLST